jgi:sugar phosphate permease
MKGFFWALCLVGCLLGGLIAVVGIATANGSPQQAAAAAMGVSAAVIPYCLARAMSEIGK